MMDLNIIIQGLTVAAVTCACGMLWRTSITLAVVRTAFEAHEKVDDDRFARIERKVGL